MSIVYLSTKEDIEWLRSVHIPTLPDTIIFAELFGTEDYPDIVAAFDKDHYEAWPVVVYAMNKSGVLEAIP